jgi:hypothetical protein
VLKRRKLQPIILVVLENWSPQFLRHTIKAGYWQKWLAKQWAKMGNLASLLAPSYRHCDVGIANCGKLSICPITGGSAVFDGQIWVSPYSILKGWAFLRVIKDRYFTFSLLPN